MNWKPGDKFTLALREGPAEATILCVVTLAGVREFALHDQGIGYAVSHIPTGFRVSWSEGRRSAIYRAWAQVRRRARIDGTDGMTAIRAAIERRLQ